jgi:hypothetical protein
MHILSYDVASKSLAMSLIKFNDNWKSDLDEIQTSFKKGIENKSPVEICQSVLDNINKLYELLDTLIQPLVLDVVDLIPGKKVKETDVILRANRLRGYLKYIDETYLKDIHDSDTSPYHVLVEYQMGPNNKSNSVCSQILYHYATPDCGFKGTTDFIENVEPYTIKPKCTVEIIGPSLKNKLNLDIDKPRHFFIAKYAKTYDANKKHSVANMKYWLKTKNAEHMLSNINTKNLDDIADSVTMTLAWLFIKSGLL